MPPPGHCHCGDDTLSYDEGVFNDLYDSNTVLVPTDHGEIYFNDERDEWMFFCPHCKAYL